MLIDLRNLLTTLFVLMQVTLLAQYSPELFPIVPKPLELNATPGYFEINKETSVVYSNSYERLSAEILKQNLEDLHQIGLKTRKKLTNKKNSIQYLVKNSQGTEEGYLLSISTDRIQIVADNPKGAFYATQTLMQLVNGSGTLTKGASVRIPNVEIKDSPALSYRGLLLDVARYYMPVAAIKKYIDLMAYYKMNHLHLHLTDDQGWRMEIKKYPKLHQIGSKRTETLSNHHLYDSVKIYDGIPHEGYYTQTELKDLVRYAAARQVSIIPEIEMPGHSQAALAAYPQLGCKDSVYQVSTKWGIHKEILCPSEYTFNFLENVLTEVMEVFPSKYIHIGGDESPRDRWKQSDFVQKLIRDKELKGEDGVQNYFMQRMSKYLASKGRQAIAWYWHGADQMSSGEKPILLSWQGEEAGVSAVGRKEKTIMTPHLYTYLDYYQTEKGREIEPLSIAGFLPIEKVYSYKPFPKDIENEARKYIVGVQACLWAEYIPNEKNADYKLFPRFAALAEVAWLNDRKEKDFKDFMERLKRNVVYLDMRGVNYRSDYFR